MPVGPRSREISSLKRELKRAKLFEIQRLVRRIKQLANKKGTEAQINKNQRKVERFEKELDFLKDVNVNEIVSSIAKNGSEDGHQNVIGDDHGEDSHEDTDLQKRALDRIINSTKLQNFLQRTEASNKDLVGRENNDGEKRMKVAKQNVKTKALDNSGTVKLRLKRKAEGSDSYLEVTRIKGKQNSADLKLTPTTTVSGEPEMQIGYNYDSSSDEEQSKLREEKCVTNENIASELLLDESAEDDGFLASSDMSGSDFGGDDDDMSSLELKPKGLESCFVQSMSGMDTGKGTKDRNKQVKGRGKPSDKKGKKNRKGQRARQKMWQKVHGKSAKHLQKNKTGINAKGNKESRKQNISNIKTQQQFLKQKSAEEPLHPSWEAMKKKRSQETLKVEFTGKRIKFDDSE